MSSVCTINLLIAVTLDVAYDGGKALPSSWICCIGQ